MRRQKSNSSPAVFVIDLFSGAGGVTTGFEQARKWNRKVAKVIACVNHCAEAIRSHQVNHQQCWHFTEDIRTLDVSTLASLVRQYRKKYPVGKILLWASLECTHFSNAKNGSRNQDSRTLAEHLLRYIDQIQPDMIWIENVREFRDWGPLQAKCQQSLSDRSVLAVDNRGNVIYLPNPTLKSVSFSRWKESIISRGYCYEDKDLNSADYGEYTKRIRYFAQFNRPDVPIVWPTPTHARNPGLDTHVKKWKAVKEVLDLTDEGRSIFGRKKPLAPRTLARYYAGLIKYVAGGKQAFESHKEKTYQSGMDQRSTSVQFLSKAYGGPPESHNIPVDGPAHTITAIDHHYLISTSPLPATELDPTYWLDKQYNQNHNHQSIHVPAATLTVCPKLNLIKVERAMHFLVNTQYRNTGSSIEIPCFTLIARMDKTPPLLLSIDPFKNQVQHLEPQPSDSAEMLLIREFMALYGIGDIKMRALRVEELKKIQGFPESYYLYGNLAMQKKFIGNSVTPRVPRAMIEATVYALEQTQQIYRAA